MKRLPARKRWGQHFLTDPAVARRIVEAASLSSGETAVEIGPGDGALTRLLAGSASRLLAVEIDPARAEALRREFSALGTVRVLRGDAQERPIAGWLQSVGWPPPAVVVGNLPYNVATPLVSEWVREIDAIARIVVMVQREVADRLAGRPGDEGYGYLSVRTSFCAAVERLFDVPPGAFRPRPKVVSSVIRVVPKRTELKEAALERTLLLASRAFASRRKTLANALASLAPRGFWIDILRAMGRSEKARAEELTPEEFAELARRLSDSVNRP